MRHGKSGEATPGMSDFDRPLNERGKHDAPEMGQRLKKRGLIPELIVSSPSKRTIKTAKAVADVLGYPEQQIDQQYDIYEAEISDLMHVIRSLSDSHNTVMMIGHNPSFTSAVGYLTDQFIANLPTSGMACISFGFTSWKQVTPHSGTLGWLDTPKNPLP